MFDGLPVADVTAAAHVHAIASLGKLTAAYIGPARQGRGAIGNLYRASNGITYFVPDVRSGGVVLPVVTEAEEVISNPSGFYNDMLFISVSPHLMARGLRAALEAACRNFVAQNMETLSQCG